MTMAITRKDIERAAREGVWTVLPDGPDAIVVNKGMTSLTAYFDGPQVVMAFDGKKKIDGGPAEIAARVIQIIKRR